MQTIHSTLLTIGWLAASVAAQQPTMVFPAQAVSAEGETSVQSHREGAPWWSNPSQTPGDQHFRMQLVADLPPGFQGDIDSISFRRDGAILAGFNLEQWNVELEITLSTAQTTASNASATFAANAGADATTVLARRRLVFGAKTFTGSFPEPFVYTIDFDQPFAYDASRGSLCMEFVHWSNDLHHPLRLTPLDVAVDAMVGSKTAPTLANVSRCFSPNPYLPPIEMRTVMAVDDSGPTPMLRMHATRQYAQHHSRGFLIGSMALTSPGVPVPGFAAGGCGRVQVDLTQQLFMSISNSDDYGRIRWPQDPSAYVIEMPYNRYWAGYSFYVQELNYNVHTQEWAVSNWEMTQIPNWLGNRSIGLRAVWAEGPGSHQAASGTLGQAGVGPVIRFN